MVKFVIVIVSGFLGVTTSSKCIRIQQRRSLDSRIGLKATSPHMASIPIIGATNFEGMVLPLKNGRYSRHAGLFMAFQGSLTSSVPVHFASLLSEGMAVRGVGLEARISTAGKAIGTTCC